MNPRKLKLIEKEILSGATEKETFRDFVKTEIERWGRGSSKELVLATGIPAACLSNFISGHRGLSAVNTAKLLDHFGFKLRLEYNGPKQD